MNNIAEKVFNGEGFLSNYHKSWRPSKEPSFILKINPIKLFKRYQKYSYFYEKRLLHRLIDANIDIFSGHAIVFSEWENKVYSNVQDLKEFLKNNHQFHYIEYAK